MRSAEPPAPHRLAHYPSVNGNDVIKVIEAFGFRFDRWAGSHKIFVKAGNREPVPVPIHGGRDIPLGTFRKICKQAGITPAQFFEVYRRL